MDNYNGYMIVFRVSVSLSECLSYCFTTEVKDGGKTFIPLYFEFLFGAQHFHSVRIVMFETIYRENVKFRETSAIKTPE